MNQDSFDPARPATSPENRGADAGMDREALLDRLGGDETILVEVVKVFLEDAPGQVQAMETALAAGDRVTLRRLAHTMKGAAGTVGALSLQAASLALERAVDTGDLAAVRELMGPFREHYEAAERIMGTWVTGGDQA